MTAQVSSWRLLSAFATCVTVTNQSVTRQVTLPATFVALCCCTVGVYFVQDIHAVPTPISTLEDEIAESRLALTNWQLGPTRRGTWTLLSSCLTTLCLWYVVCYPRRSSIAWIRKMRAFTRKTDLVYMRLILPRYDCVHCIATVPRRLGGLPSCHRCVPVLSRLWIPSHKDKPYGEILLGNELPIPATSKKTTDRRGMLLLGFS